MNYKWLSIIFLIVSVLVFFKGLYQFYGYDNGTYSTSVNAYVGGDAYNYIINANRATAYFTVSGFLFVGGLLTKIIYLLTYDKGQYQSLMTKFSQKENVTKSHMNMSSNRTHHHNSEVHQPIMKQDHHIKEERQ